MCTNASRNIQQQRTLLVKNQVYIAKEYPRKEGRCSNSPGMFIVWNQSEVEVEVGK